MDRYGKVGYRLGLIMTSLAMDRYSRPEGFTDEFNACEKTIRRDLTELLAYMNCKYPCFNS